MRTLKLQAGVSMIETLMVFPIMLLIGLGIVHLGLVYQAKSNLEYAALMAARVGAVNNINVALMRAEAVQRMAPSNIGNVSVSPGDFRIIVLNPTLRMFEDCGQVPLTNGVCDSGLSNCELPNFGLQYRPATANCDGVSIQDANLLRIEVIYHFNSHIPFMNVRLFSVDTGNAHNDGVDISAVATVRMQSPARYNLLSDCAFTSTGC